MRRKLRPKGSRDEDSFIDSGSSDNDLDSINETRQKSNRPDTASRSVGTKPSNRDLENPQSPHKPSTSSCISRPIISEQASVTPDSTGEFTKNVRPHEFWACSSWKFFLSHRHTHTNIFSISARRFWSELANGKFFCILIVPGIQRLETANQNGIALVFRGRFAKTREI